MRPLRAGIAAFSIVLALFRPSVAAADSHRPPTTRPSQTSSNVARRQDDHYVDAELTPTGATGQVSKDVTPPSTTGRPSTSSSKPEPRRPIECQYTNDNIKRTAIGVAGSGIPVATMVTYQELAGTIEKGGTVEYYCVYTDTPTRTYAASGTMVYGVDRPLEAYALDDALTGWRERIELVLGTPTVVAMPGLENQRVGFESWFGLPTFTQNQPVIGDNLMLFVDPASTKAEITVPRPGGREPMVITCPHSGIGADGRPNGDCPGRFNYATAGTVTGEVAITYQVQFASPLLGGAPIPLGPVTMRGPNTVNVKDLQATAS